MFTKKILSQITQIFKDVEEFQGPVNWCSNVIPSR